MDVWLLCDARRWYWRLFYTIDSYHISWKKSEKNHASTSTFVGQQFKYYVMIWGHFIFSYSIRKFAAQSNHAFCCGKLRNRTTGEIEREREREQQNQLHSIQAMTTVDAIKILYIVELFWMRNLCITELTAQTHSHKIFTNPSAGTVHTFIIKKPFMTMTIYE